MTFLGSRKIGCNGVTEHTTHSFPSTQQDRPKGFHRRMFSRAVVDAENEPRAIVVAGNLIVAIATRRDTDHHATRLREKLLGRGAVGIDSGPVAVSENLNTRCGGRGR